MKIMEKLKLNNKRKMFNFRTTILVIVFVVLSILHANTTEAKVQMIHKHHKHNSISNGNSNSNSSNNNNENNSHQHIVNIDDVIQQKQQQHNHNPNHHHQHQHQQQQQHHHHHHHHHHHQNDHHDYQRQRENTATPSLEFTTISSLSVQSDNEFLIKQPEGEQQQHEPPLINKDDIYYRTKEPKSSSSSTLSTTSQPSFSSIHPFIKHRNHKIKSTTLTNSIVENTHHSHYNRSIPMPLSMQQDTDIGNSHANNKNNSTTISIDPYENSKRNLSTEHQHHYQQQLKQKEKHKLGYDSIQQTKLSYDDYYSDDIDDENDHDDEDDSDDDDDYIGDDGDSISYDDDNNLSDRLYARITRSKLDDDYADDEPNHNGINDLEMQRDAAPGVLTEQKYLEVGNEKAVQQARERYIQEQKKSRTPHELATEHWHRMIQATKCRKPLPRVIPVSNNTSKRYEPYATILHRCGDDTGCCGSTASICTVKRYEIVMVYVFSYDFNYRKEIEALPMQNHTECHCVNRGSLLHDSIPRDKRSGSRHLQHFQREQKKQESEHMHSQLHSHSQYQLHQQHQQQQQQQQQLQNMLDCQCPRHFNVFEEDVERHAHLPRPHNVFIRKCRCDCVINNQTCLRFKHGEEGFSLEDRKCILERNCRPPVCSHGDYNLRTGRCPSYRSHLSQMT